MRHLSSYLHWYVGVPPVKYDFRSSGLSKFIFNLDLHNVDLSVNYTHGNPETSRILAQRYQTEPENVFISGDGTSGQNARIIRVLAERNPKKYEAIVEYPTYEPLLRQVEENFKITKRFERRENEDYELDTDRLRKIISPKTGLLVLTNPHAPSAATAKADEFKDVVTVAKEQDCLMLCDEVYAEFDRARIPTCFSIDPEQVIVTSSFTKAYGLGGLRLGVALAKKELVDEFYSDVLNTVGNSANLIQSVASELLGKNMENLEKHKNRWNKLRENTEKWLGEEDLEYFPNKSGVTYWTKLPKKDTYEWVNKIALPQYGLAPVPGTFFMFKKGAKIEKSNMIRLGLGNIDPNASNLEEAFTAFEKALKIH